MPVSCTTWPNAPPAEMIRTITPALANAWLTALGIAGRSWRLVRSQTMSNPSAAASASARFFSPNASGIRRELRSPQVISATGRTIGAMASQSGEALARRAWRWLPARRWTRRRNCARESPIGDWPRGRK